MSKKRLTVIINSLSVGGAENMVCELVKNIDRTAFDVRVLCYGAKRNTPIEEQTEKVCPVIYLDKDGHISPLKIVQVVGALWKTKPDVVHAHLGGTGFGAIWAILYKKPLVITVHASSHKAFSSKIERFVRCALKTGKTKIVAVFQENETALKEYFGLSPKNCSCVNNGIDLSRFSRKEHKDFTLINVARQDDNKNQAALLRCFHRFHQKYPNSSLLLLGDGPNHVQLKEQAKELGMADKVTFTGNVPNTQDYYAVSDVYVQSSHREAMPLSVLEAMAAGLPIVSTDVGGLRDVVQENGILVPDHDEEALYKAMERVYTQDKTGMENMCRKSLELVQNYSSQKMARAYEMIYGEF